MKKIPSISSHRIFLIVFCIIYLGISFGLFKDLWQLFDYLFIKGLHLPFNILGFLSVFAVSFVVLVLELFVPALLDKAKKLRVKLKYAGYLIIPFIAIFSSWLIQYYEHHEFYELFFMRTGVFLIALTWTAIFTSPNSDRLFDYRGILIAFLVFGAVYTFIFSLHKVVDYPFSLSWSEGNRLFDYSTFYRQDLYHLAHDHSIVVETDPIRNSLWGLPFLHAGSTILTSRLWDRILFSIPSLLFGMILLWPQKRNGINFVLCILFGLWVYLYFDLGPIYAPIIISAMLVFLIRKLPVPLGVLLTILAGCYVSLGRLTWIIGPPIWAGAIVLLDAFLDEKGLSKRNWQKAAWFTVGGLVGGFVLREVISFMLPEVNGGPLAEILQENQNVINILLTQPLLFNRLLPNPVYHPGIIGGVLLVFFPLVFLIIKSIRIRLIVPVWLGLIFAISVAAFCVCGIVVCLKIGGGNLHNMDMLFIFLVMILAVLIEKLISQWVVNLSTSPIWFQLTLGFVIVFSSSQYFYKEFDFQHLDTNDTQSVINDINNLIEAENGNGEILFLDQRQLLTYEYIKNVPLVNDYEKKILMEMAMASEEDYFHHFYDDLISHRFSIIVSEKLTTNIYENGKVFGEENNAWVNWVSIPMLCAYEPIRDYAGTNIEVLVPRKEILQEVNGYECFPDQELVVSIYLRKIKNYLKTCY